MSQATELPKEQLDCTPCRLMGTGVFVGLGAYTYISGHSQLTQHQQSYAKSMFKLGARRLGITGMSATLVGMGIYRWFA